jgi:uncharacterized SAM-binding protein YcdF (DUF218 family)
LGGGAVAEKKVDFVVGCGGVGRNGPAEGAVIADLLRAEGLPEDAIRVEPASRTTRENLRRALPILRALGADQAVIVTDAWHAPRALLIARQEGLRAAAAPVPWRMQAWRTLLRHLPREALALAATALRRR